MFSPSSKMCFPCSSSSFSSTASRTFACFGSCETCAGGAEKGKVGVGMALAVATETDDGADGVSG